MIAGPVVASKQVLSLAENGSVFRALIGYGTKQYLASLDIS